MILTKKLIQRIENLLEADSVVEVRLEGEGLKQHITASRRPLLETEIPFPPSMVDTEERTVVAVFALKGDQEPVVLGQVEVPAGWYVGGIKGFYKKES